MMARKARGFGIGVGLALLLTAAVVLAQEDPLAIFAVVTKVPKDKKQVTAQLSVADTVSEGTLIASEEILANPIWRKLEICHSLKVEAWKSQEGYRVVSVKVLDAGMLPM
ncbi:MAG: hypothetical protein ACREIS_02405, partial [Nitrospiraceae bacterium]